MKKLVAVLFLTLSGCVTVSPNSADLDRTRAAVRFSVVESPDMTGYSKHWTRGPQSAWFNMSKGDVLILNTTSGWAFRISGFPKDFGHIVATGWERNRRFFVHLSPGADTGTVVYFDLLKKKVTEVKHWGAW
jgi:hypothetical protein